MKHASGIDKRSNTRSFRRILRRLLVEGGRKDAPLRSFWQEGQLRVYRSPKALRLRNLQAQVVCDPFPKGNVAETFSSIARLPYHRWRCPSAPRMSK